MLRIGVCASFVLSCLFFLGCEPEEPPSSSGFDQTIDFSQADDWGSGTPAFPAQGSEEPPATNTPPVAEEPTPSAETPSNPPEENPPVTPPEEAEPDDVVEDVKEEELPQEEDICLEGPNKTLKKKLKVYYGTAAPTYLPMTPGQMMAVGTFWGCSGLLIADTWVLTASHCGLWSNDSFCIGPDPNNPNICIPGKAVYNHPTGDIALFELASPASNYLPQVEPIPLLTEDLHEQWVGKTGEAAGYGSQEDGGFGEREFTAEPIVYLGWDYLVIDGQGMHGVCFGDSGGPLMVIDGEGAIRVAGALSGGDDWCTGEDIFTRVDVYRDWLEGYTGPTTEPGPISCTDVDTVGFCNPEGTQATFCNDEGNVEVQHCPNGYTCSWYSAVQGWRCVEEAIDPCNGITPWGACNGNVLFWCDTDGLLARNCGACGETCVPNDEWGYICVESTCGDLLFTGECNGSVATWCTRDGEPESLNCAQSGQSCGWVDDQTGFYCK